MKTQPQVPNAPPPQADHEKGSKLLSRNFMIEWRLWEKIRADAFKRRISYSQVVREALESFYKK